jgi:hypothetical protein
MNGNPVLLDSLSSEQIFKNILVVNFMQALPAFIRLWQALFRVIARFSASALSTLSLQDKGWMSDLVKIFLIMDERFLGGHFRLERRMGRRC